MQSKEVNKQRTKHRGWPVALYKKRSKERRHFTLRSTVSLIFKNTDHRFILIKILSPTLLKMIPSINDMSY